MAAKLHQLPVPDMADGIWSAIEMQLDAPANVPGAPAHPPVSNLARSLGYGFAALVAAALIWWFFSHKEQGPKQSAPPRPVPEIHTPLPVGPPPAPSDSPGSTRPAQNKNIPARPAEIKKDSVSDHNVLNDSIPKDSAANPLFRPSKADSSALQQDKPTLPDVDLYAIPVPSPPQRKKNKGVKGITSDDYKITASKDSTKKKD